MSTIMAELTTLYGCKTLCQTGHPAGYVYIDEVSKLNAMMMADYYASNHTCHVYVVPLRDQYIKYSLAAPKDSQLHSVFDPL